MFAAKNDSANSERNDAGVVERRVLVLFGGEFEGGAERLKSSRE